MMRIGVQKKQGGELEIDPYYEQNMKNAKAAGLKVGVYLYSIATSQKEAIEHANWVIKTLNKETLDLPIVFDWENWSKWNTYKMSFHEINAIKDNYIKVALDNGYEGMLYSSKFYLENIWTNKNNYPIWLAHYTSKTSYTGKYIMWQLCNDGKIDGINGAVDIDILYH
jgi:GH25 family lysozyme M1 (1,4-beta-N-acetylmuramidase)